jgi:cytochrome bd ubiquinol oxidase subunit I
LPECYDFCSNRKRPMEFDPILLSRLQFAFTTMFHIIFPSFTIGLGVYLVVLEGLWLKTKDETYYQLTRFWTKIFALSFGMGVVTGIVLAYEFGTNFSKFSATAGNVIGPLMSYETLTAFFLEAGFLGIVIFGWKRVPPKVHYFATCMVAAGALISTFWILAANSWMHTPTGHVIKDGVFHIESWWDVIFNPSFPYRYFHMVIAALLSTAVAVAGISAWYLIKKSYIEHETKALKTSIIIIAILAPIQILVGDLHGLNTLEHQPMKVAAMEGHWEDHKGAPLVLFGIPDMEREKNHFEVAIPHLGSLILKHSWDGELKGLKSVAKEDRPFMPIPFFSFRIMVALGMLFLLTGFIGIWLMWRKKLYESRLFHRWCILLAPFGFVATICGWFVTETGRQPWVVHGLLRTKEMASPLIGSHVFISLSLLFIVYCIILSVFFYYFFYIIKQGPDVEDDDYQRIHHTPWIHKR